MEMERDRWKMEREKDVGRTSETRRKSGRQWTRTMEK